MSIHALPLRCALLSASLMVALATGCTSRSGGGDDSPPDFSNPKDTEGLASADGTTGSGEPGAGGEPEGGGDPKPDVVNPARPEEAEEGTVAALQVMGETEGCDPGGITTIAAAASVTGAVVTSPVFEISANGGLDGFYVQDPGGGAWAGVLVAFDKDKDFDVEPGDVVDLAGTLEEGWCNTQLEADSVEVTGSGEVVATIVDAAAAPDEAWEGVLITVEDVEVVGAAGGGSFDLEGGLVADHDFDLFLDLDVGATYTITGPVKWAFDAFRLMPRSEGDIVEGSGGGTEPEPGPTPEGVSSLASIQGTSTSTDCDEDGFLDGDLVVVHAVVISEGWSVSANLNAYGIRDGEGPSDGALLTLAKSLDGDWPIGTSLAIEGEHLEFYCQTQISADQVEILEEALEVGTEPIDAAGEDIDDEAWEGAYVQKAVTVTGLDNWDQWMEATTDAGVLLDDEIIEDDFAKPTMGETYLATGVITWGFGNYRIALTEPLAAPGEPEPDPDAGGAGPEGDTAGSDVLEPEGDGSGPEAEIVEPEADIGGAEPEADTAEPEADTLEPEPDAGGAGPGDDVSDPQPEPDASGPGSDASEPPPDAG